MRCVARSTILLKPHVIGIHIIHFRLQEVAYYRFGRSTDRWFRQTKIRTKQWLSRDAFGTGVSRVDWYPKFDNFACSHIHPKMGLITKDDLFGEIWVNFQLLQNPISEHTALSMVYLKFLGQLNFIGVQIQVPTQNSPSWSRRKAKFFVNDEKLTVSGFPVHSHAQ